LSFWRFQHGEEMDITTGFEYINDEGLGQSTNQKCEITLLSSVQLQESPFTYLARFVAQNRQVGTFISKFFFLSQLNFQCDI
jgi:hypothetical protein